MIVVKVVALRMVMTQADLIQDDVFAKGGVK